MLRRRPHQQVYLNDFVSGLLRFALLELVMELLVKPGDRIVLFDLALGERSGGVVSALAAEHVLAAIKVGDHERDALIQLVTAAEKFHDRFTGTFAVRPTAGHGHGVPFASVRAGLAVQAVGMTPPLP